MTSSDEIVDLTQSSDEEGIHHSSFLASPTRFLVTPKKTKRCKNDHNKQSMMVPELNRNNFASMTLSPEQRTCMEANRKRALNLTANNSGSKQTINNETFSNITPEQRTRIENNRRSALARQGKVLFPESPSERTAVLSLAQRARMEANRKRAAELRDKKKAVPETPKATACSNFQQGTPPVVITPAQRARMEANRKRAAELRAAARFRGKSLRSNSLDIEEV